MDDVLIDIKTTKHLKLKREFLNEIVRYSITEKHLRSELDKNNVLHRTLNRLIEKSYVMRTSNKRINNYALSPNGKKIIDLFKIIDDLDLEWTESERLTRYLLSGYTLSQANYEIKRWKEERRYPTMCSQCFGVVWVKENRIFVNNNLCVECELNFEEKDSPHEPHHQENL